ncbi:MAG: hypothetical protein R3F42_15460 [Pseudomonadota bacterium]
MTHHVARMHDVSPGFAAISKPGTLSLLAHIVRGTVADGMQVPVLLCIAAGVGMYHYGFAHHQSLAMLLATGILVTGLIRGCAAWQQELDEYQRQLAIARLVQLDYESQNAIPGFYPPRHY